MVAWSSGCAGSMRLETLLRLLRESDRDGRSSDHRGLRARHELITDYYDAAARTGGRAAMSGGANTSRCAPNDSISSRRRGTQPWLDGHAVAQFTTSSGTDAPMRLIRGRRHDGFARHRTAQGVTLFDKVAEHVKAAHEGSSGGDSRLQRRIRRSGLQHCCRKHGATTPVLLPDHATSGTAPGVVAVAVWSLSMASCAEGLEVIGEENPGDRAVSDGQEEAASSEALHCRRRRRSATAIWSSIASTAWDATKAGGRWRSRTRARLLRSHTKADDKLFRAVETIAVSERLWLLRRRARRSDGLGAASLAVAHRPG